MSVKVITDSTCDLPPGVADQLGITIVPLGVQFGLETFRDGIDMNHEEFYRRLLERSVIPKTAAPSPGAFKECYQKLAGKDGVVSIHISSKLSGTYNSAQTGKLQLGDNARVEVIDSLSVSMGLGLLAITAARAAKAGANLSEITKLLQQAIGSVWMVGALDTLEFLQKGGRVGKTQAWIGSLLSIKPIISLRDGEVVGIERVRTHSKAVDKLNEVLKEHLPAKAISVMYSTDLAEAEHLVQQLKTLNPKQEIYLSRFGPVLGTYVGPGALAAFTMK